MKKWKCLLALIVMAALVTFAAGPVQAFAPGLTFFEDPVNGLVMPIPTAVPTITVASDGEAFFDPFNFGADTSGGIQFAPGTGWVANAAGFPKGFSPGYWTFVAASNAWVMPASTPSGNENEPTGEPPGGWFLPGAQWLPITPAFLLFLEQNGEWSDTITMNNLGPGGSAQIIFQSNPIPLPPSVWLLGSSLLGLMGLRRFRKS